MAYWPCLLDRLVDTKEGERRITKDGYIAIVVRDLSALLNSTSLPNRLYTVNQISGHNRVAERMSFKFGFDAPEPDGVTALDTLKARSVHEFPLLERSTVNYGFRDLNGTTVGNITMTSLVQFIRLTIERFEPRVRGVQVVGRIPADAKTQSERDQIERNLTQSILSFEIRCRLEVDGIPHDLRIKSDVDLKTGHWTTS
jgi:type VI secretion system lysozyme-like protein